MALKETFRFDRGMSAIGLRKLLGEIVRSKKLKLSEIVFMNDRLYTTEVSDLNTCSAYLLTGNSERLAISSGTATKRFDPKIDKQILVESYFELTGLSAEFLLLPKNMPHFFSQVAIPTEYTLFKLTIYSIGEWETTKNYNMSRRGYTVLRGNPKQLGKEITDRLINAIRTN